MRLSLRFVLPLMLVLAGIAWLVTPLVDKLTLRWFVRDLDARSELIANTVEQPLQEKKLADSRARISELFNRITQNEKLLAIGYCASENAPLLASRFMPIDIKCDGLARYERHDEAPLRELERETRHVIVRPLPSNAAPNGKLVMVHDMSFYSRRSEETRRYLFYFFMGLAAVVSLTTVIVAQLSWRGWMSGMRALLRGEGLLRQPTSVINGAPADKAQLSAVAPAGEVRSRPEFLPIARDLRRLVSELEAESRTRDEGQINWTPETLRAILRSELRGDEIIVVSNREPYVHVRDKDGGIEVQLPASGLVTALEPIMRACSGTWIAHGSGSADRATVDAADRVRVPPQTAATPGGKGTYQLRRIWLTEEEERGYYLGFANEGLWPLCHIAHVRPVFRSGDWEQYQAVNRKFCAAVVEEAHKSNPIVLVQDYHFALLPRMIREALPEATVIAFWHIPWPNPESFAVCPWRNEVLVGLLGSSILGFHTQFHCNNFFDCVDRFLEARVDRETFTVSFSGQLTAVQRYPISIEWPPRTDVVTASVEQCRSEIRARYGLPHDQFIGIGVDRLDYTKGITERFRAVERLFELNPEWVGRLSFIQIAAPTRGGIEEYQMHEHQVRDLADAINQRFGDNGKSPPIVLKVAHHDPQQVYEHYRGADFCFVASLHDGMNLVAKEFVAARDDGRGVLILSQFTGAARELVEALIVNPYDIDQCAAALHLALTMPEAEQRDRMRLMRGLVAEFNVYRWAGRMLLNAAAMRRREHLIDAPQKAVL